MKKLLTALILVSAASQAMAAEQIKFVTEATYPPFEMMDANNEFQGFDIDIARAICAEINAECSFANQSFDSLIPSLKFRRYDAAIAAMDVTPARKKQVDFSDIYYENSAVLVAEKGKYNAVVDLAGKSVGVQNGTSHQAYMTEKYADKNVLLLNFPSYQKAFLDLKNGRIDGVFADSAVAHDWLTKHTDGDYETVGKAVTDEQYFGSGFAIAVRKDNAELLAKINAGLQQIKANGSYDKIYAKYFAQ
jgi:arginine transport system substrate-binding protein